MREVFVKNAPHPAMVDDDDFAIVGHLKWQLHNSGGSAIHFEHDRVTKKARGTLMHRMILRPPAAMVVDHIDHDALHNWRSNMRVCTQKENTRNQRKRRMALTSQYKGVYANKKRGGFFASITVDGKETRLGWFADEVSAALTYNEAARARFGEFACLNHIDTTTSMRISA